MQLKSSLALTVETSDTTVCITDSDYFLNDLGKVRKPVQ